MQEAGGRRIKRSINIDMNSIRFCDKEMLSRFGKFELIRDYVREKEMCIRDRDLISLSQAKAENCITIR